MKHSLIILGILVGACGGDGGMGEKDAPPTAVAQRDGESVPSTLDASTPETTTGEAAATRDAGVDGPADGAVASGESGGDAGTGSTPASACICGVSWEVEVDANGTPHCRSTSETCTPGESCPVTITNCRTRETPSASACRCGDGWVVDRDDDGLPRCRVGGDACQPGAPCVRPVAPCL